MDVDACVEAAIETMPDAVVASYRRKFHIAADVAITPEMVRRHWRVERSGVKAILSSRPETRTAVVSQAYTDVYGQCPWLNSAAGQQADPEAEFGPYRALLGDARRVYEVGSGKGRLIAWLAAQGFDCVGTEITAERGRSQAPPGAAVAWHTTDGVHLERFEPPASFDAVLSVQVIEHLHPDDLPVHFVGAARLLRPGGRYIFATPHRLSGPADLSAVFWLDRPVCQHLKEYGYRDLAPMLHQAGFGRLSAVYVAPLRLRRWLRLCVRSRAYLGLLQAAERGLDRLPLRLARRLVGVLARVAVWRPDVFIVAELADAPRVTGRAG